MHVARTTLNILPPSYIGIDFDVPYLSIKYDNKITQTGWPQFQTLIVGLADHLQLLTSSPLEVVIIMISYQYPYVSRITSSGLLELASGISIPLPTSTSSSTNASSTLRHPNHTHALTTQTLRGFRCNGNTPYALLPCSSG
jgi:hypothetical protein